MNGINKLFSEKSRNILSVYFTAGYPLLDDTVRIISILEKHGVDLVEIGIPFSDPVADGPVIQESNLIALKNGMNLQLLFEQLRGIKEKVKIPLVMMGYFNPIYQMGMEKFLLKCYDTGIDGVIIPDLPVEEYLVNYRDIFRKYNIHFICLITPQTPEERVRFIDSVSEGFIYMVSTSSTTGARKSFDEKQVEYFHRIHSMDLKNPVIAGFGISNKNTYDTACKYANGVIIGSAFIKALGISGNLEERIGKILDEIIY